MFLAGVVLLISMTGLDQDMMQRNLSCATPRDSQKNIVLTAVSQIFVIFLFLVLGVLLYIYIGRTGLAMPVKGDQVFSLVAVEGGLPVFVGILFVIGGLFRVLIQLPVRAPYGPRPRSRSTSCKAPGATVTNA